MATLNTSFELPNFVSLKKLGDAFARICLEAPVQVEVAIVLDTRTKTATLELVPRWLDGTPHGLLPIIGGRHSVIAFRNSLATNQGPLPRVLDGGGAQSLRGRSRIGKPRNVRDVFFTRVGCASESKRVVVNIAEGQVTPVRVMVSVLSISESMQSSIRTIEWLFKWDVAAGEPQPYYDLASLNHAFEESFGLTDWGRFGKMFIEGKDMREVQDTKLRIDRAIVGLNLSEARDRTELLRRYYQDRPKEMPPGVSWYGFF